MKKIAMILLAALLAASLVACSCGENEDEKELRVETGYSSESDWTRMY